MSSSIGSNESSFGNPPAQVSSPAFEGDRNIKMNVASSINGTGSLSGKGGAFKPSKLLGTIAGVAAPAAVLVPALAPIAAPIAAIAGIGSQIAKLFGGSIEDGDGFTQKEMDMMMEIKRRMHARRDIRGVVGSPAN